MRSTTSRTRSAYSVGTALTVSLSFRTPRRLVCDHRQVVEVTGQGRTDAAPPAPADPPHSVTSPLELTEDAPIQAPVVIEPTPKRRIRQPADLGRTIISVVGAALLVALGQIAVGTTSGVEQDILGVSAYIPSWVLDVVAVIVVLGLLALPVTIAVDQIVRRRSAWILDELLAAALGFLLAYGLSLVLSAYASRDLLDALTRGEATDIELPVAPFLAALVAFVSATGVAGRRRLQLLTYVTFAGLILESLIGGLSTPLALLVTLLVGRASGLGVRYVLGTPNPRPGGAEIALVLRRIGIDAAELRAVDPQVEDSRRYLVHTTSGRLYRRGRPGSRSAGRGAGVPGVAPHSAAQRLCSAGRCSHCAPPSSTRRCCRTPHRRPGHARRASSA